MPEKFDLIVIGSGPAGEKGAAQAAFFGKRVALIERERVVKETERARIMENLRRHHVTVYMGEASFVDPHTVAIKAQRCAPFEIKGDVSLIATGSYPYRPENFPFHDSRVYDSDTIINLHEIPATMLVVGGGVVGCEYACMFAALGIQVTLVEKRERLISSLDEEIAQSLKKQMEA